MSDPLYTKDILRLAADSPARPLLGAEELDAAGGVRVTRVSPICGSKVDVDVTIEAGRIAEYRHRVKACALGQAAASIMATHVAGRPVDEMRALPGELKAFLQGRGPCPAGVWADLHVFAPAREHKSRHASILLSFDAVAATVAQLCGQDAPSATEFT